MLRRRLPKDTWSGCVFSWAVLQIPSPVPSYGGRPPSPPPAHWWVCYIFSRLSWKAEPFPRHNQVNIGQKLLVLGRSDQTYALWFGFFSNFDFRNSSILLGRSAQTHTQWFGKFKSKQMCLLCICMFCLQQSQNTRIKADVLLLYVSA